MYFKDEILTFEDTKIVSELGIEVMMDWEAPIMEKTAEYICQSKGDILEIGFGMGICADYIQAQGVNSHTIIEIHPQILEKLNAWASTKSNITIIEGDWSTLSISDKYDGIFLDTFENDSISSFKDFALARINAGGYISYWNNKEDESNLYSFDELAYDKVKVNPDSNCYTDIKEYYYMPKVES